MAVLGSKGVGVKVSCGANSDDCGDCDEVWVEVEDLRPVNESQLLHGQ